ncbi:MAG: RNA polymerase sigma factor (sigma-70 family) [Glaciecola sp.]|jgi:RNA polymerase sigma factor (sigma-70 family)
MMHSIDPQAPLINDVLLAQNGDIQAYERLIKHCQNAVTSIALAIVKDIDDSEEVAQQVFVSIWQNLNKLKNPSSFLPWVRQSTRYAAFNFLRDSKAGSKVEAGQADLILQGLTSPQLQNDEQLYVDIRRVMLRQFIDELAQDEREIVLLYYREEQSTKHVASLLDISEANVRKKLSRVRQTLKANILKQASAYIYGTAPALGFSAAISTLLIPSAPVAAATVVTSISASSKAGSGFLMKFLAVIGGSLAGAFIAVFAIIWSSNIAIRTLDQDAHKKLLKRYRNETIAWVIIWCLFITAGYEFTFGWIGPVLTYTAFAIGLVLLMIRSMGFIHLHGTNKVGQKANRNQKIISYLCMSLATLTGFAGLIVGLISSGRLVF